jgi:CRISPR-associated protein Cmr3
MKRIGVVITPLDTLFFRGGRPFGAGLRAESGLPGPQVFAGLVRTMLLEGSGADFGAMRGKGGTREAFRAAGAEWVSEVKCRGPWLAEMEGGAVKPLVAAPANLEMNGEGMGIALAPWRKAVPGWTPPEAGMLPLWSGNRKKAKVGLEWLGMEGLWRYLRGEAVRSEDLRSTEKLVKWEERTGLEIEGVSNASKDGAIYSTRALRLDAGVGFYGEVELPEEKAGLLKGVTPWGGERHLVEVKGVDAIEWPEAGGERTLALMVSPGLFTGGWRPAGIAEGALRGAAVKGPFAVSGWDLTRGGPKATRFGVDAGTVYFMEGGLAGSGNYSESDEDAALGYGIYLKGKWNYAE